MYSLREKLISILVLFSLPVFAVSANSNMQNAQGNILQTQVESRYGYIDNFLYTPDNEQSTSFYLINPSLFLQTEFGHSQIQFNADITHIGYQDFNDDDHSNTSLMAAYHYKPTDAHRLFVSFDYNNVFEERGTGLSRGNALSLNKGDEKNTVFGKLGYIYGTEGGVAKINVDATFLDYEYDTRRTITRILDRREQGLHAQFKYLLSGQSYFTTDLQYDDVDVRNNDILNKKKYTGLVGISWQSTSLTNFQALVGYQEIDFTNSLFGNDNDFMWRFAMNWRATQITEFRLSSRRRFDEANLLANSYRLVDEHKISLTNKTTENLTIDAEVGYRTEEITFTTDTTNEDYLQSSIGLTYQSSEWLSFDATFNYRDVDATDKRLESERQNISVGVNVKL